MKAALVLGVALGVVVNLCLIGVASAHPGNTDGSGCHTCRTNCPSWGYNYGEYHCHGGGGGGGGSNTYDESPTPRIDSRYSGRYQIQLDGTGSWDDQYITSHSWIVKRDSTTVQTSSEASWLFEAPNNGTYVATLTVKDSYGHTASDSYTFEIGPPFTYYNGPPTAVIVATTDGWNITLDGTNSTDPDHDELNFTWVIDGQGLSSAVASYHPSNDGQFQVSLQVLDPYGLDDHESAYVDFSLNRSISLKPASAIFANETVTFHLEQLRLPLPGNFTWRIEELNLTATGANFTALFPAPGNFTVQVVDSTNQTLVVTRLNVAAKPAASDLPTTESSARSPSNANDRGAPGLSLTLLAMALGFAVARRRR